MIFSVPKNQIIEILIRQLENFFPILDDEKNIIISNIETIYKQCEENFIHSPIRYFKTVLNGITEAYFSPFHSGSWTVFLYYFSHHIFTHIGRIPLADKLYYLNKIMNGVDIFYDVELPKHFSPSHQIGTVLGRAKYGDYFYFLQNCTVGENFGSLPIIGENCFMCANSAIIGKSILGNNVTVGAGCIIKNDIIGDNVKVFGSSPNLIIKPK